MEYNSGAIYVGMTAMDLVVYLVSSLPEIKKVFFRKTIQIDNLEQRSESHTLEQLFFHKHNVLFQKVCLEREEVTVQNLTAIELTEKETLSFTSRVEYQNGEIYHLPMLDFNCPISASSQDMIANFIKKTLGRGVILNSGRSYQVYGVKLLSEEDIITFLGYGILLKNYADYRYIGHRLIDRELCLRLTTNSLRPHVPRVVGWV